MGETIMSFYSGYKSLYHPDRVKTVLQGGIPKPITVEISPTSYCNHRCTYCAFDDARNTAQLAPAVFKKLIRQLSKMGVKSVNISGTGEPLVYPDIADFIKMIKVEERMDVGIITNGSLLHKHLYLADLCSYIRISLDACTAETHKKIHGTEDFSQIIHNIGAIIGKNAQVGVQFILCKDNECELNKVVPYVKDLGVDYIQIKPVVDYGKLGDFSVQLNDRILLSQYEDDKFKVVIKTEEFQETIDGRSYKTCNAVKLVGSIVENGDMSICCHLKHKPDFAAGNINMLDFYELWGSIAHQRVIDSIDVSKCPPSCGRVSVNVFLEDAIESTRDIRNTNFI